MNSTNSNIKRLNVGCGTDIRTGWVNLDSANLQGVNVVHDLESLPLPFEDNIFDEILCQDVLEHLNYIPVLQDLHRILKPSGRITIRVPHFSSKNNFIDPTHKKMFSWETFEFFSLNTPYERGYYFPFKFDKLIQSNITFAKKMYLYDYPIELLINTSRTTKSIYESTMLARLFPAMNVEVILEK